jgi:hypothetical protein
MLISFCLHIVLILMEDRCTIRVEHTTGSEIILDAPDVTPRQLGSCGICFGLFEDSVSLGAR